MSEVLASNKVSLHPEGYIEIILVGDQTHQTIEDSAKECQKLAEQLRAQGERVLGLIDFRLEKNFSTGANKATLDAMSQINYDRGALFGTSLLLKEVSGLIIKALGKGDITRVFGTREEAVAWLVMKDPLGA